MPGSRSAGPAALACGVTTGALREVLGIGAPSGGLLARVQNGRGQIYLRLLAVAVVILAAILIWSGRP